MELFNKSGVLVSSVLVLVGALIACQAKEDAIPASGVIEAAAMQIGQGGQSVAERRLQEWAEQGSSVAQRELALRYLALPGKRAEAVRLFERAASAGDARAADGLVALYRETTALNVPTSNVQAPVRAVKDTANSYALHSER